MKRAHHNLRIGKSIVKRLLGMTASELTSTIGNPYASYFYRDEEVFLYEKAPVKSIALQNGVVIKCDTTNEVRRYIRVRPKEKVPVIATGKSRVKGEIHDISVAGISLIHSDAASFRTGESVSLSFLLSIDGYNRYLELTGVVKETRVKRSVRSSVIMFDFSSDPSLLRLISRYMAIRMAQNELQIDDSILWGNPDTRCAAIS